MSKEEKTIDVEDFIWQLKCDGLYTQELEDFINNYIKFRR